METTDKEKQDIAVNEPARNFAELIRQLKEYDTEKFYKRTFSSVSRKLDPLIKEITLCGDDILPYLHAALEHEETWSCWAALKALREIKNPKSIQPLIAFILKNENGDRWEGCEDAMFALNCIGKPAIIPLISALDAQFEKKNYPPFLTGALTGIKDDETYRFMTKILKDYIANPEKYDDWINIDKFVYDFDAQGRKEVLPILKDLASMDHLSSQKKREIRDTIKQIEDPEGFQREIKQFAKDAGLDNDRLDEQNIDTTELLKEAIQDENRLDYDSAMRLVNKILRTDPQSYHALFLKSRINRKLGKPDLLTWDEAMTQARKQKASRDVLDLIKEELTAIEEVLNDMANIPDESLELHFKCQQCGKTQNIHPGLVWIISAEPYQYIYEHEIMCKRCRSHDIQLTQEGEWELRRHQIRALTGNATGLIFSKNKTIVGTAGKRMEFSKGYPYLEAEIKKKPQDGELRLRIGNIARKMNLHEEAINHYTRALELNPRLIDAAYNLFTIYKHRHEYYKIPETKEAAITYLKEMRRLYNSKDYDSVTISESQSIIDMLREEEPGYEIPNRFKKVDEENIREVLAESSTHDMAEITKGMTEQTKAMKDQAKALINEAKGVLVMQSYHTFDKKTRKGNIISVSSVMPIESNKVCICGSGKPMEVCCMNKVRQKTPFVENLNHETFSTLKFMESAQDISTNYQPLIEDFKKDPRFYCQYETKTSASFVYYGNTFFIEENLGTLIFGNLQIKKTPHGASRIKIEALSEKRFDALAIAVKEHIG
ncbi:hypothetical protein HY641_02910 [Candidatus Woesearchaeota archaeon]|nr:hypothetical protein [Candidatus Woesearchaeota archaeon]